MEEIAHVEDDTLVLIFGTKKNIGAADVGMLLRDLSGDYQRTTGGRLVLWRYETGSSWIYLRDAIAVAGSLAGSFNDVSIAVQHMRKFARLLWEHFEKSPNEPTAPSQIRHLAKSAARITKIAAEHGADVAVRYKKDEKAGLETYSLNVNHQQIQKLHLQHNRARKSVPQASKNGILGNSSGDVVKMAQNLALSREVPDVLVNAIVLALKNSGGDYLLPSLANELEGAGRNDLAIAVRKHAQLDGNSS